MADAAGRYGAADAGRNPEHPAVVRMTHWLTALCFLALLVSGLEIVVSHPRFYWGETGNVNTPALFQIPIPASRSTVPTGYGYVLPDQNGWSRSLHFQAAWGVVLTGLLYVVWSVVTSHLRKRLLRPVAEAEGSGGGPAPYNAAQRAAYLTVIFAGFPVMIWTGLAMSPAFASICPWSVAFWGGQQSARTIHFFTTLGLVVFAAGHVLMVYRAGFVQRTGAMITGGGASERGQA